MRRDHLQGEIDTYLDCARFTDYCPNGLQVEGREEIARIVTGVTASLALIERAIALRADALLVHHGYFWRGEDPRIIRQKRKRLGLLLAADLNLFAYHLPLDAHGEVGNNVMLARRLGWSVQGRFGKQQLGCLGSAPQATIGQLAQAVARDLGRTPLVVGEADAPVGTLAWCTGGAQDWIEDAWAAGARTFVSGEISEPTAHFAREMGITYLACGHHATERDGIRALGDHLAAHYGLDHVFIDLDNPA
ncbi:putative GTP cyclohydrolase 1 type 2 [Thiomonas arsenitoxydans]|jgi:dinuclear metal center YbgI/SA1388 family protein|uniref:GTP cyclohydrolase 1 type 2 n=1 Tax=Thiomonas arsenitoxydans (strain DSM 22701 / CIP 110005 / 3As) TaxID=426114 RepID=D6CL67_THIA3|nr:MULTISPECIES: Nif3-like dinuclear metal center hexameric protein [Thiomonas]OYV28580.1 MAG: Nif3-like dinuclear metal center hexameric protein [Thiomonas sp. 20-64-9]CQR41511.1 putative GTP cyclohydrolase 1 type 2 [Thiomonas sp. CB3]MDD5000909.1 Nif3-like dinuclear metal center hexameric protein [Thiomonas arsenitoxydans]OZB69629.1 MAG: Nif3-like dinuclear metal center hexameric protein [Thiomonas sp. 13-64-67]CAZ87820.1 putative NGG1p interacting factor, ybgI [Thiomonas arsenitoxydans]